MPNSRLVLLIGISVFCFVGCGGNETVRVGFLAHLTGAQAELGVQERNGVRLTVEEITATGSIGGRPVELVVPDDPGVAKGAREADRELIEVGAVAIMGYAGGGQAMAGLPVTNPARFVMLNPTVFTKVLLTRASISFKSRFQCSVRRSGVRESWTPVKQCNKRGISISFALPPDLTKKDIRWIH